uniref:Uncharacterized protein n=1 Tax=Lactuca sativa TaxID=4236 RepID=A0A9R1W6E5_LACSA|nr:hypothetical protein LSAT_V11C300119330 [Lactuca sativa]
MLLSRQLVKESLAMIRSQIPFGRKSMLEAYVDIVFRAWKAANRETREEISWRHMQALVDSSTHEQDFKVQKWSFRSEKTNIPSCEMNMRRLLINRPNHPIKKIA